MSGPREERPKRRGGRGSQISSQSTKCRSPFACSRSAFRDPRSSSRPEGSNALGFIKRIGLVRPEMALDRAPRGLTRRCRRRFHFFVAPRSALRAFIFSAHGAPACSLLSERILSEMKQQQQQQQQAREALQEHLHNKHAREEERQPPCKKSCSISSSSSSSSSSK